MGEIIDSQAREDIGKLYFRFGELATDYWGPTKTNGKRSEIVAVVGELAELKIKLNHYIDAEREETCIGLREFAKRDAFKAEIDTEVTEVKVAEINANSHKETVKWQTVVSLINQGLILAGIIFVAVMQVA